MERAVVVDLNVHILDGVEVNRDTKEQKKSKKSRMTDDLDDNDSASPDVITIKIKLRNERNRGNVVKDSQSNRKLRFVFEEETEVDVVEDETRKIKNSKKRRLEVTPDEEIVSSEYEETVRKKKKKRRKKPSTPSRDNNDDEPSNEEDGEDTTITKTKKKRKKPSSDVEEMNDDINKDSVNLGVNKVTNIVDETVSNDLIEHDDDEYADETITTIPTTDNCQKISKDTIIAKYPKSPCPECGIVNSNLVRHYRHCHPEFSKEDVLLKTGGTQRQLLGAKRAKVEYKKIACPICHCVFGSLPRHLKYTHGVNVSSLAAKKTVQHRTDNSLNTIISEFKAYLVDKNPAAVNKNCAATYLRCVKAILMYYLPSDGRFTNDVCGNFSKLGEKNGFFEHLMKTSKPSSVYAYFTPINKFINFIAQRKEFWWFDDSRQLEVFRLSIRKLQGSIYAKKKRSRRL